MVRRPVAVRLPLMLEPQTEPPAQKAGIFRIKSDEADAVVQERGLLVENIQTPQCDRRVTPDPLVQ